MTSEKIKKIFATIVGALAGNVALLGFYPFGIAYLTSGYLGNVHRLLLFPIIMISMAFSASTLQVAKYGISMVVVIVFIGFIEKVRKKCSVWMGAVFAGITITAMEIADYILMGKNNYALLQGIAEGVLVASLTVIFSKLLNEFLAEKEEEKQEVKVVYHPGKEKIKESAAAFRNLASTFYAMPNKKETLSKEDLDKMAEEVSESLCCTCEKWEDCWKVHYVDTYKTAYNIWEFIEKDGEQMNTEMKRRLGRHCVQPENFLDKTVQSFKTAKLNLIWNNRMIENREAVADQLSEMAAIITGVAEEVYEIPSPSENLEMIIKRKLRGLHLTVNKILILERKEKRREIHITMCANGSRCIATKEVERIISKTCKKRMVSSKDSRSIINKEYCTIVFVEDVDFKTLYGVSRATKKRESISGDNFSFLQTDHGQMIISLSDGMGSGINAYKESALVIDLLEQFLEAGFQKETAVKMINSSLVMRNDHPFFSTVDISSIDLYSGVCEFLKIGASTTFIKRDNWVETISSTSLPVGVFHQVDIENISKKLYEGDFVIMVTDGILDALPIEKQELLIQEIIMEADSANPQKISAHIMERILEYTKGDIRDDMTVLVTGIWKK